MNVLRLSNLTSVDLKLSKCSVINTALKLLSLFIRNFGFENLPASCYTHIHTHTQYTFERVLE